MDERTEIINDLEARRLMRECRIELSIDDERSPVQYMSELLLYLAAEQSIQQSTSDKAILARERLMSTGEIPYFA